MRMDAAQHGVAPAPGKVDVEQDDVGQALGDQLDGGLGLVRLAHHLDGVAELGLHAGTEHRVVLDEKDPGAAGRPVRCGSRRAHRTRARRGIDSCTSAPWPGADRTTAAPPKRTMRARIDWAMPWRSSGTVSGSKPQPRSRT